MSAAPRLLLPAIMFLAPAVPELASEPSVIRKDQAQDHHRESTFEVDDFTIILSSPDDGGFQSQSRCLTGA